MRKLGLVLLLCVLWPSLSFAQGVPKANNITSRAANDTSTGTVQYSLAKIVSGAGGKGKAIRAGTGDTNIPLGVVLSATATTGQASIAWAGETSCTMDATNASGVANQPVLASTTVAGQCHTQPAEPTTGKVIGRMVDDATTSGSQALIRLMGENYTPGTAGTANISAGLANRLAVYPSDGTTLDDLAASPTNNKALKGNGTAWVTMSTDVGGAGACTNQFVRNVNADAVPTCNTVTSADVNNTVAATGSGINTSSQPVSAPVNWSFAGTLTPIALSGDVNDYNPTNFATRTVLRVDGGAADRNITGFAAQADGDLKRICNVGTTNNLILKKRSTGSSAANQIASIDDVTIAVDDCKTIEYDGTTQRWRLFDGGVPDYLKIRPVGTIVGDPGTDSPALSNTNDSPQSYQNHTGRDLKVLSMGCYAAADDAGSVAVTTVPVVRVILVGGSATSVFTADCACGDRTFSACSVQTTAPVVHSWTETVNTRTCSVTPCGLDFQIVTAGGVAKYIVIDGKALIQ